mmetsp:Transcript_37997/g.96127  ORF Transcript_37997/g.96127 Transcript_37997/m.96127 type:complete len:230 (+) Transcript_37997:440-1129(+)
MSRGTYKAQQKYASQVKYLDHAGLLIADGAAILDTSDKVVCPRSHRECHHLAIEALCLGFHNGRKHLLSEPHTGVNDDSVQAAGHSRVHQPLNGFVNAFLKVKRGKLWLALKDRDGVGRQKRMHKLDEDRIVHSLVQVLQSHEKCREGSGELELCVQAGRCSAVFQQGIFDNVHADVLPLRATALTILELVLNEPFREYLTHNRKPVCNSVADSEIRNRRLVSGGRHAV